LFQFRRLPENYNQHQNIFITIPSPSSSSSHQTSPKHTTNSHLFNNNNNNPDNNYNLNNNQNNSIWDPEFTFEFSLISVLKRYFFTRRHESRPLQIHSKYIRQINYQAKNPKSSPTNSLLTFLSSTTASSNNINNNSINLNQQSDDYHHNNHNNNNSNSNSFRYSRHTSPMTNTANHNKNAWFQHLWHRIRSKPKKQLD
jgi:hypothetical protein